MSLQAVTWYLERDFSSNKKSVKKGIANGVVDLVGNTPLLRIKSLSERTGCEVGGYTTPPLHRKDCLADSPLLQVTWQQEASLSDCSCCLATDTCQGRIFEPWRQRERQGGSCHH